MSTTQASRGAGRVRTGAEPNGELILHVKNLASLYLSTLRLAKKVKAALGRTTKMEYVRSFSWYVRALEAANFELVAYNSFNLLVIESMPDDCCPRSSTRSSSIATASCSATGSHDDPVPT